MVSSLFHENAGNIWNTGKFGENHGNHEKMMIIKSSQGHSGDV